MEIEKVSGNAVQQITDVFTQQLIEGKLRPGDQIPTEVELAERFGVSRNTVREAIKILVSMGVLEIRRPVGTYVCNGFSESMISPILYGIILGRGDSYDELIELREVMEIGTMLTVIRNASDEEIASLESPLNNLKKACLRKKPMVEEVFSRDDDFHEAIMGLSHNRIISQIAGTVRTMTHDMRMESVKLMVSAGRAEELYMAHVTLFQLLTERNVTGVYSEIRGTYFVPDGEGGAVTLSAK